MNVRTVHHPRGAHTEVEVDTGGTVLAAPSGANSIWLQAGGDIRWRIDAGGTAGTASGFQAGTVDRVVVIPVADDAGLSLCAESGTVTVNFQWGYS